MAIAQTQSREAKALFYPKVNFNFNYVRYRNETLGVTPEDFGHAVLEAPIASQTGARATPLAENLYLGRLGFRQTLYSGGKLRYTYKLSKAGVKRAESAYETLRHEVEYETTRAYFTLLALRRKDEILNEAEGRLDALAKERPGEHGALGLSRARAEVRRRRAQLEREREKARFDYLQSMGMELFSDARPAGALEAPIFEDSLEELLVRAKENRAELKETQIQEELDQLSIHLSQAERYPVFLLGGGVEVRDQNFPLDDTNWNTALSMSIPIFDGFTSIARVRENRLRAEQGRLNRVRLEDEIEREARSAFIDHQNWKREAAARAEELSALESRGARYAGRGSASLAERLDFAEWRVAAQLTLVDARYELCLAAARLVRSMGRSLVEE